MQKIALQHLQHCNIATKPFKSTIKSKLASVATFMQQFQHLQHLSDI